jgi:hypothetical protein
MTSDYRAVLNELRAEEKRLLAELEIVRSSIPGVELLSRRTQMVEVPPMARFSAMGTKEGILTLLEEHQKPLASGDISRLLLEGGIQTKATDFTSTVTSTLNTLKTDGLVYRVEDGWTVAKLRFDGGKKVVLSNGSVVSATLPNGRPQPSEQ